MNKILLIDDDDVLLDLLSDHIDKAGFKSVIANNGEQGLLLLHNEIPDLIILDVMMPKMDGWEICKRIREISPVPIIMLTAKDGEIDKLRGFRLGVDDYVTKPFSFAELIARVNAVFSRINRENDFLDSKIIGNIYFDFENRRVKVGEQIVDLTPTEYRLISLLVRNLNRTVPTEQILFEVWGAEYRGQTEHVKRYIWTLRKKLEDDPGNPQHLITERGFGYRFE